MRPGRALWRSIWTKPSGNRDLQSPVKPCSASTASAIIPTSTALAASPIREDGNVIGLRTPVPIFTDGVRNGLRPPRLELARYPGKTFGGRIATQNRLSPRDFLKKFCGPPVPSGTGAVLDFEQKRVPQPCGCGGPRDDLELARTRLGPRCVTLVLGAACGFDASSSFAHL